MERFIANIPPTLNTSIYSYVYPTRAEQKWTLRIRFGRSWWGQGGVLGDCSHCFTRTKVPPRGNTNIIYITNDQWHQTSSNHWESYNTNRNRGGECVEIHNILKPQTASICITKCHRPKNKEVGSERRQLRIRRQWRAIVPRSRKGTMIMISIMTDW